MSNETTGGVSKRSLILLGAFAALALNREVRRGLVQGTRDAVGSAQDTLQGTVKPALSSAAQQAGETLGHLREEAGQTIGTIREEAPGRAQSLLGTAQEVAGTLAAAAAARAAQARQEAENTAKRARKEYGPKLSALGEDLRDATAQARKEAEKAAKQARKEYVPRLSALGEDLRDVADDRRHEAQKALRSARKSGRGLIGNLGQKASSLLDDVSSTLQDERQDIEYRVARARRQAEKELRRSGKKWNAKKLEKAVDRRVAPLQKEAGKQLALLEKQLGKKGQKYRRAETRRAGVGGGTGALLVLGAGTVALARFPQARQSIMDAVGAVSPEAADKLHGVGQQIRGVVGEFWVERDQGSSGSSAAGSDNNHTSNSNTGKVSFQSGSTSGQQNPGAADKNGSPTRNN